MNTEFSTAQSQAAKLRGMDIAAAARAAILQVAREAARNIASINGTVTADDVQEALINFGYKPSALGNAAGSIFRGSQWEFTGRWTKSARVSSHRNDLRVWKLRSAVSGGQPRLVQA